jgi:hypothetical protein
MNISKETQELLGREYDWAVQKHGPTFKTLSEGLNAMLEEFREALRANRKGVIEGEHGVRREVAQIAAVCVKLLESIRGMKP